VKRSLAALAGAALAAALIAAGADPAWSAAPRSAAIFYYAWYGTPALDGAWQHWDQSGRRPPFDLGTTFYPARGPYSSSDPAVVRAQLKEIAETGVDTLVFSWWGTGSPEDARLALVASEAHRAQLALAIHVEPYAGRTAASVAADIGRLRTLGVRDYYVYDSTLIADDAWAAALRPLTGVHVLANTSLVGRALAGGFDGIYTYDVLINSGSSFRRICGQAHRVGLLCAPSVGPGFDARRATTIASTRTRRDGRTYDTAWRAAVHAAPDIVTITSYNEWHEGTQIEPARAVPGYEAYDGAFGVRGAAAETAYLERTRAWVQRLVGHAPAPAPAPATPLGLGS
jgi:glycoprotein endo-alpha-1,2-mannosidase